MSQQLCDGQYVIDCLVIMPAGGKLIAKVITADTHIQDNVPHGMNTLADLTQDLRPCHRLDNIGTLQNRHHPELPAGAFVHADHLLIVQRHVTQ